MASVAALSNAEKVPQYTRNIDSTKPTAEGAWRAFASQAEETISSNPQRDDCDQEIASVNCQSSFLATDEMCASVPMCVRSFGHGAANGPAPAHGQVKNPAHVK
jgi:hypothetical protein